MSKEYITINPNINGTAQTMKANYGRMSHANAVHTDTRKATFIMEREISEPKILSYSRDDKGKVVRRHAKDVANTIYASRFETTAHEPKCYGESTGWRIRKLTPIETGRLMGLEDAEIQKMYDAGIPKTQLYKLHGNSIVVDVLFHIFRKMFVEKQNESKQLELF